MAEPSEGFHLRSSISEKGIYMPISSAIEFRDIVLKANIGTYGPNDVLPKAHVLDLVLTIDPSLVLIKEDLMENVFDYDHLIKEVRDLAHTEHYETQERLVTCILQNCFAYDEIEAVEILLRKQPVLGNTGEVGVRLIIDKKQMRTLRAKMD
ncbi:MAG: dihydroneopterin aldolase [Chloroflexota bacterium]